MLTYFSPSWQFSRQNWKAFLPVTIPYIVLLFSPELVNYLVEDIGTIGILFAVISGAMILILDFALVDFTLKLGRGERTDFFDILAYSRYILPIFGWSLCLGLPFLFTAMAVLKFTSYLLPLLALLFLYLWARTLYWRVFVVEKGCGIADALVASWRLTQGKLWETLKVLFATLFFDLFGLALLLLGALIFLPFSCHILIRGYEELNKNSSLDKV